MGAPSRQLRFLIPALFEPLEQLRASGGHLSGMDTAAALLARADRLPGPDDELERVLCDAFGLTPSADADLPVAALTRLADTGHGDDAFWLRADPLHLRADRDRLLAFGGAALELSQQEAAALVGELNAHFQADGWTLEAPHPARWYLRLSEDPGIRTTAVAEVLGKDVDRLLPTGPDARRWHGLLNEVQMLLHSSAVNAAREDSGTPAVNSVWFWGGGRMPHVVDSPWDGVWSDEPLAKGLAMRGGVACGDLPAGAEAWLAASAPGSHLLVMSRLRDAALSGDLSAWSREVEALARDWLEPLRRALMRGSLERLEVVTCDGQLYRIGRRQLWRFWRTGRGMF
jgi:hypothetical protein